MLVLAPGKKMREREGRGKMSLIYQGWSWPRQVFLLDLNGCCKACPFGGERSSKRRAMEPHLPLKWLLLGYLPEPWDTS